MTNDLSSQVRTISDIFAEHEAEIAFQATLHPSDPRHKSMVEIDTVLNYVSVFWGGYSYDIELSRIKTPSHIMGWIMHLVQKDWPHITPQRIGLFVKKVADAKGWKDLEMLP